MPLESLEKTRHKLIMQFCLFSNPSLHISEMKMHFQLAPSPFAGNYAVFHAATGVSNCAPMNHFLDILFYIMATGKSKR